MKASIGIIGMGWVGSSVAISVLQEGIVNELLLNDIRPELAEGEAMDLAHGESFYPSADVQAAAVSEMLGADAIVISAGRGGRPGESRLHLLQENALIVRAIAAELKSYAGLVVVVSNPVDVLTRVFVEESGLPKERVIGTGTMLDTARLRQVLGRELGLDPRSIHAQVVGEHGDSQVALWSSAQVGGAALDEWQGWSKEKELALAEEVRGAAGAIIKRKGATNHAIGLVTAALLKWSLRRESRVLTVSRVQTGACGVSDVALSLPAVVSGEGAVRIIEPGMNEGERKRFLHSARVLEEAYQSLN